MGFLDGIKDFLVGKDYSGKQKGDFNKIFTPLQGQLGGLHGSSQAALLKALGAIEKGFGSASDSLAMQGAAGTRAILGRERQGLANNRQSLISRGLDSSTVATALDRGTAADTNAALNDLQTQLAALGSNLDINKGQAIAQAYGGLAANDTDYSQLLLSLGLGRAGALQGVQYGKQGGNLGEVLKIGAGIFGSDRRVKKNIVLTAMSGDGSYGIYEFEYEKPYSNKMPGRYRGVMAQEVQHIPGAVFVGDDGYMRVRYDVLGFNMLKVG